jgi:ATP adenylyltransferase/5',5'''-P-1,P-4-tetraphosphate phosphorylase II
MTANQKKVTNAFADTNPDFDLGHIGPRHKLILNKYSVVRPQFVLPTIEFEPQSSPLNASDSAALWDVLIRLGGDYIATFNCGADAGASVGHKHMQILPHPEREMFKLFPDTETLGEGKST